MGGVVSFCQPTMSLGKHSQGVAVIMTSVQAAMCCALYLVRETEASAARIRSKARQFLVCNTYVLVRIGTDVISLYTHLVLVAAADLQLEAPSFQIGSG